MSPEDIARAFVACSGWTWWAGMESASAYASTDGGWRARSLVLSADGDTLDMWGPDVDGSCHDYEERASECLPDVTNPQTLDIIAGSVLRGAWPGHSVQVETFPDGSARVLVFDVFYPSHSPLARAFAISHKPVAESLLACLQAAPGEAAP